MILTPLLLLLQAATATPAPAVPPAAPVVPWAPRYRTDASTGAKATTASANSQEKNARLVLRCDDQGDPVVSIQYITREPLGAGPDRPVSLSFDGGPPIAFGWEMPGAATFVRDAPQVTALTIELAKARMVKVHAMTIGNVAIDATFPGPGSDAPVKAVLEACGYTLGQVPAPKAPAPKKK